MFTVGRKDILRFVLFLFLVLLLVWYVLGRAVGPGKGMEFGTKTPATDAVPAKNLATTEKTPGTKSETGFLQRDFYIETRLERERTRGQQIELLKELTKSSQADAAVKKEAFTRLLQLGEDMGKEIEMENLIRARGFEDALVFLGSSSATVLIKAADLNKSEVAKIADIVARVSGLRLENISILPKSR
ncbi:MAG: SpoIIIAH-like family protein [Firmicutes bacterium]|nr:SpoIIIAH-like family protein [Bacillota bacterium]MCL5039100.1 SpoIIIAH-like family protein [Bacillota bacterium]